MNVWSLIESLVQGLALTPAQLAELRAINSLYYTESARQPRATDESERALSELVVARVRAMLGTEQRQTFDRALAVERRAT